MFIELTVAVIFVGIRDQPIYVNVNNITTIEPCITVDSDAVWGSTVTCGSGNHFTVKEKYEEIKKMINNVLIGVHNDV